MMPTEPANGVPLDQCGELLGVDFVMIRELVPNVEPYLRTDGNEAWSLMQLERRPRPATGGYIDRRYTGWLMLSALGEEHECGIPALFAGVPPHVEIMKELTTAMTQAQ